MSCLRLFFPNWLHRVDTKTIQNLEGRPLSKTDAGESVDDFREQMLKMQNKIEELKKEIGQSKTPEKNSKPDKQKRNSKSEYYSNLTTPDMTSSSSNESYDIYLRDPDDFSHTESNVAALTHKKCDHEDDSTTGSNVSC